MPPSRRKKSPDITIIGAGTLATALAVALYRGGYGIREIVSRDNPQSLRRARSLAKRVGARVATIKHPEFAANITWLCVPDDAIAKVAEQIAGVTDWKGKIVVHSSGALASGVLDVVRRRGAQVASAHPLMTFVSASAAELHGVPFAMEGDAKALRALDGIVRALGGKPFRIAAEYKPAYHCFGFFSSPALVALIAAAQQVGKLAGLSENQARKLMEKIVRQTIDNCFRSDPSAAFSGPIKRGDVDTVRKHLEVLKETPELLQLYRSLGEIALKRLPNANSEKLKALFKV
jgi:predicted short-subunit dehydrogenase-like oxidoreductase (DUF2520 family)